MILHHLGYAVQNIDKSRSAFEALGYRAVEDIFHDVSRNCYILFMKNKDEENSPLIELIATADLSEPSPVDSILKSKNHLYHQCFAVENIHAKIAELTEHKWHLIDDVKSAPAIGEKAVAAFMLSRSVGMIELISLG